MSWKYYLESLASVSMAVCAFIVDLLLAAEVQALLVANHFAVYQVAHPNPKKKPLSFKVNGHRGLPYGATMHEVFSGFWLERVLAKISLRGQNPTFPLALGTEAF